ncbi:AI-2E family transporter [Haloferax namakaokahaiae]|uniref:AI-2E family transporter n=1 Tax=Haloferax namakaokahaiae TaxID=1748331 RepID=A0ABD5ZD73_9EURY
MSLSNRKRIGWWLYVLLLGGLVAFLAYSFVDILALGIFGYYATRPVCRRLSTIFDSERIPAVLTVLVVLLPVLLLTSYMVFELLQQLQRLSLSSGGGVFSMLATEIANTRSIPADERARMLSMLNNPLSTVQLRGSLVSTVDMAIGILQLVADTVLVLALSLTLSYALLERDNAVAAGLVVLFGGRNTTAYTYAVAIDEDLESVFFGNLLFVLFMSIVATLAYSVTNAIAPEGLRIPLVLVLGLLTGITSLVPIVVGKLVYLPVVAYLGVQSMNIEGNQLPFVGAVLLGYVLVLDLLPQSVLQPYISGRQFDTILLLFAYILGPMVFGWYGFFLLPILTILVFEVVRIVLPGLLHGDPLGQRPLLAAETGSKPQPKVEKREADDSDDDSDSTATSGGSEPNSGSDGDGTVDERGSPT